MFGSISKYSLLTDPVGFSTSGDKNNELKLDGD